MTEQNPTLRHHDINYVEISALDLGVAKDFYTAAFGWTFNDYGPGYAGIQNRVVEGAEVGGLCLAEEVVPGGPLVLLFSDDLDASVESVVAAGGQIVNRPYEFPGGRRFHFADPSGNELGVWATS